MFKSKIEPILGSLQPDYDALGFNS